MSKDGIVRMPVLDDALTKEEEAIVGQLVCDDETDDEEMQHLVPIGNNGAGLIPERDGLIEEYWRRKKRFSQEFASGGGVLSAVDSIILELMNETDKLLGNEMLAMKSNDIQTATVVSTKRSEMMERAVKVLQRRQQIGKELSIDLDHPHVTILFKYLLDRCRDALESLKVDAELIELFFVSLSEKTREWKRDVTIDIERMAKTKA